MVVFGQWHLAIADNKQSFQLNGKPFFWLGDTDWEMIHRLNREELREFIKIRATQGFNVLQVVVLAEFNGLQQPNQHGDIPLIDNDPTRLAITEGNDPNDDVAYDYWDHLDFALEEAAKQQIFVALLPTWGDKVAKTKGIGPKIFNEQNIEIYGSNLAKRLSKHPNIIWVNGGDRIPIYKFNGVEYNDTPIWRALATGLKTGDKEAGIRPRLMTYHTRGGAENRTALFVHGESWLDFNAFQTGHGSRDPEVWQWVKEDLSRLPKKPTLDLEPCYEDHPVNPWGKWTKAIGYFTAKDVRLRIVRGVVAGGAGATYGHHHVWQFMNLQRNPPVNVGDTIIAWQKAVYAPAARQMKAIRLFFEPFMNDFRTKNHSILLSDGGKTHENIILTSVEDNYRYAFISVPYKQKITIDLQKFKKNRLTIAVFDPIVGKIVERKKVKNGIISFESRSTIEDHILLVM
jgi:hypothetical protein